MLLAEIFIHKLCKLCTFRFFVKTEDISKNIIKVGIFNRISGLRKWQTCHQIAYNSVSTYLYTKQKKTFDYKSVSELWWIKKKEPKIQISDNSVKINIQNTTIFTNNN